MGRALCCVEPTIAPCAGMCSWPPPPPTHPTKLAGLLQHACFQDTWEQLRHTWPGMCWLRRSRCCPPSTPPGAPTQVGGGARAQEAAHVVRRQNDSDGDRDSMESPQEAHTVTQCMFRASVPVHEGWEFWDAATSSTGLGTRKAVAPLPGALRSRRWLAHHPPAHFS